MNARSVLMPLGESVLEQHRTAAVVIGAEPVTSWRPVDRRLCRIVDAAECVGISDVGLVVDELHAADPSWPWPTFIRQLLTRWDERLDAVEARRRLLELGRLVDQAHAALEVRVDALVKARVEADRALAIANRACDLFEREARALDTLSPSSSRNRLTVCDLASSGSASPANDLDAERRHA